MLVIVGFTGLLICSATDAPHAALTAVLAITGLGFGPLSMSMLMAAQDAVTWQQRGVVTGALSFFRTIGGAVGIGLLGGMFNLVARNELTDLHARGVNTTTLLDPHVRDTLPPDVLTTAQRAIADGLVWVFAAMLAGAVVLLGVSFFIPNRKTAPMTKTEAFEASVGG